MMKLLPLELEYCEAVAEIARECLPEHWSLEGIQDVLLYNNNIYYVVMEPKQNRIVAFAGIMIVADEAELLNVAVTKNYRKQGLAQQLLDRLFLQAKEAGAYRMLLEVRRSNEQAQCFYNKNGFAILGERRNYYANPTEDAIIMERML